MDQALDPVLIANAQDPVDHDRDRLRVILLLLLYYSRTSQRVIEYLLRTVCPRQVVGVPYRHPARVTLSRVVIMCQIISVEVAFVRVEREFVDYKTSLITH